MSHPIGDPAFKDNGAGRCWHCGKTEAEHIEMEMKDALAVALSAIENLDLSAWERCEHDSDAYRDLTGAPSLAEAAAAIRAVLPAS